MCNFILVNDPEPGHNADGSIDWAFIQAECRVHEVKERLEHRAINAEAEATGLFRHSEPKSIYSQPGRAPNPPGCKQTAWQAQTPKHERRKQRFAMR